MSGSAPPVVNGLCWLCPSMPDFKANSGFRFSILRIFFLASCLEEDQIILAIAKLEISLRAWHFTRKLAA
jgi:hypothetical protein